MAPNNTTGGGAPMGPPDGAAPELPSVVPDSVQALLDGIFGFTGDLGQSFGQLVSDLAGAIGGGGGQAIIAPALDVLPHLL